MKKDVLSAMNVAIPAAELGLQAKEGKSEDNRNEVVS